MATPVGRSAQSDKEILMNLPKGSSGLPREEREPGALGGAFKDYGGDRQGACAWSCCCSPAATAQPRILAFYTAWDCIRRFPWKQSFL